MDDTIGHRIRTARQRLGLTQHQAAARAGLGVGTVRDLEQGRSRHPKAVSIDALAEALQLDSGQRRQLAGSARRPRPEPAVPSGRAGIALLGPLLLTRAGTPVAMKPGGHRVVLARLALTPGQPVSTGELIRLIWPGEPPANALNGLQAHVSRLRRHLGGDGPPTVTLTPGGYCLNAGDDQIDVLEFRRRLERWRRTPAPPGLAFDLLRGALDLWRGDHAVPDVPELDGDPLVTALDDELVEATIRLARLGESLRRLPEVLPRVRRLAARHVWHEGLHARLVVTLAGTGQQAMALLAFDGIRRRLADELGIDPGTELRDAQRIVLGRAPAYG